jgi:exonuclease III
MKVYVEMANTREKRLKLGLLNVRSLKTGQDEFMAMILKYKIDVLAINESWIRDGDGKRRLHLFVIHNYRFIHKARKGKRGGGVGFYVRNGITTKIRHHPQSPLEQLWIEIRLTGGTLAFGTAYRPESVSMEDTLDSLSESINMMASCDYTCILGDLNVNLRHNDSKQAGQLLSFCSQHNLDQLVQEPTRITDITETILDLIITDTANRCKNINVVHNHCLSDHATVMLDFDLKSPKYIKQIKHQRVLHDIITNLFENYLESIP